MIGKLKLDKLPLIFLNPKRFLNGLLRYFDKLVLEKIVILVSLLIFRLYPQYLYIIFGKRLAQKKERWKKRDNPEDDWIYKDKKIIFDQINIICKGGSLKKYLKKINKNLPTFYVSYIEKPPINTPYLGITADTKYQICKLFSKGLYPVIVCRGGKMSKEKNNKILWDLKRKAYPDANYLKKINNDLPEGVKGIYKVYENGNLKINKKINRIIKLVNNKATLHFKNYDNEKPYGPALQAIFLLGSSSKKVNIYGWDHYLKKDVDKYSYHKLISEMSTGGGVRDDGSMKGRMGVWGDKFEVIFGKAIWNLHYADRLIKHKKYKIFSRLSKIHKQKKLLKNIEKIMFVNN